MKTILRMISVTVLSLVLTIPQIAYAQGYNSNPLKNGNTSDADAKISISAEEEDSINTSETANQHTLDIAYTLTLVIVRVPGMLICMYLILCIGACVIDIMYEGQYKAINKITFKLGDYSKSTILSLVLGVPLFFILGVYLMSGKIVDNIVNLMNTVYSKIVA